MRSNPRVVLALLVAWLTPHEAGAASASVTYTYDDAGRLISAQNSTGTTQSYSVDRAGNRTSAALNPAGVLTFSSPTYAVTEGTATVTISVTRTQQTAGAVSIQYATANGSAKSGTDYTSTNGTLNWAAADGATKTFTVPILNNTVYEGTEAFSVALSNPTGGAVIGGNGLTTVTISDNDTVVFAVVPVSVSESAGRVLVSITKTGATALSHTVDYATTNGTATAGSDYSPVSGTLTFSPGETSKVVPVTILQDAVYEGPETFNLGISNATAGATIGTATAAVTITDDETPPTFAIAATPARVGEAAGPATFTVTKSGTQTVLSHAVNYATSNGTALSGSDYTATSGTLTFLPADTTKTFTVALINDTASESDETFNGNLSSPTNGATIATAQATVTLVDNDNPTVSVPQNIADSQVNANCKVSWDFSSGAVSYYTLQRDGTAAFPTPTAYTITAPTTFYGFTAPLNDKTWFFRVRACNASNVCSAWSATLQFDVTGTNPN